MTQTPSCIYSNNVNKKIVFKRWDELDRFSVYTKKCKVILLLPRGLQAPVVPITLFAPTTVLAKDESLSLLITIGC